MHASPFRALRHYRVLPRLTGWAYLCVAFAARAPYAMIPLGTMTAFTISTGSIAEGGYATAAVALSTAVAGPIIGKWADRRGAHQPLMVLTPINAVALGALFLAAVTGLRGLPLYALCVATGLTSLPIGSFTRSRWIKETQLPRDLAAALSYESMADETVFVLGPALVGMAATLAAPAAPLALAFALVATVGVVFALSSLKVHRRELDSAPADQPAGERARVGVLRVLIAVAPAVAVMTTIGWYFGATQAATTARSIAAGHETMAGLVYAMMGIGSAVMAILTVALPEGVTLPMRLTVGGMGMTAVMMVVAFESGLPLTALTLTACGLFVGPTMVTAFSLAEALAPAGGVAIAMTSMQSAVTIGVSLGAGVAGRVASAHGDFEVYAITAAGALVVVLVGLGLWQRDRLKRGITANHG